MEAETDAIRDHGGSLARARELFPHAPEPWIDLSTGINPHPYSLPIIPASAWERLPEERDIRELCEAAAARYGAPSFAHLVAAPGTQALLPQVAALVRPGAARVLGPTYAEHGRTLARARHEVREVASVEALAEADIAVLVNPNNPDGRRVAPAELEALASRLSRRGGILVVDEAFMDVAEDEGRWSVAKTVDRHDNLVVLRSFGKFYGLAGLRLGFAIAGLAIAKSLRAQLGPWAVSGPAVSVGRTALDDAEWASDMRSRLARDAARLDHLFRGHGLEAGGTSLFRFVRTQQAREIFEACGRAGLYIRRFDAMPDALRFGLPPDDAAFERLDRALRQ
ncbi:MAG: threonine-phosphate decarboxylase [Methylobacterium mesophilicum]|nr:threonine-phosphate decarboxylase [Methylobacterium mesophilicum]